MIPIPDNNEHFTKHSGLKKAAVAGGWLYFLLCGVALCYLSIRIDGIGGALFAGVVLCLLGVRVRSVVDGLVSIITDHGRGESLLVFFAAGLLGALVVLGSEWLMLWSGLFSANDLLGAVGARLSDLGFDISIYCMPALFGFGLLIGSKYGGPLLAGTLLSWWVLVPLICLFKSEQQVVLSSLLNGPSTLALPTDYFNEFVKPIAIGALAAAVSVLILKRVVAIAREPKEQWHNFAKWAFTRESFLTLTSRRILRIEIITGMALILLVGILFLPAFDSADPFSGSDESEIGPALILKNNAEQLPPPQANLVAAVSDGLLSDPVHQPWLMYGVGAIVVVVLLMSGIPVFIFSLGMYLWHAGVFAVAVGALTAKLVASLHRQSSASKTIWQARLLIGVGIIAGSTLAGLWSVGLTLFNDDTEGLFRDVVPDTSSLVAFILLALVTIVLARFWLSAASQRISGEH